MTGHILVVDDDRATCEMLAEGLTAHGFTVAWLTSPDQAAQSLTEIPFDVLLTDMQMPGLGGLGLCQRAVANFPDKPVVVVTAFGSFETAVSALRAGAYDFVSKPFDMDTLALSLERAVKHRRLLEQVRTLSRTVDEVRKFDDLIGASEPMKRLYDLIERVGHLDSSVLISGESGTGKELVAQSLHRRGQRCKGPFVAINCASVPATLLESELFGHTGGAFTGATGARDGLMVRAGGGTLFLDEISEMPLEVQPKILRAIEQRVVRPLGSDQEISFDTRIIAATNRDLEDEAERGRFRSDLLYRLNVIPIHLPPLRDRGSDVLLLAQRFVEHFAAMIGKDVAGITAPAAEKLLAYQWPGNVRELRNCVEHGVALTRFSRIIVEDLPEKIRSYASQTSPGEPGDIADVVPLGVMEQRYIDHVMSLVNGNKTRASRLLGLDRKTLYRKLNQSEVEGENTDGDQ
jgi:DNA-binding NtrC family response regulator